MERLTAAQFKLLKTKPKRSKYNAKRTEYNGQMYDSKLEANYAAKLDLMRGCTRAPQKVVEVETQIPYKIISLKGNLLFTYLLDFRVVYGCGRVEYVDTKGFLTAMSKMKIKAVQKEYGITINLVKKA